MQEKPKRNVTSHIDDDARLAAWGDNQALLALGRNGILVSAAPDTIARTGDNGIIALPWFDKKKNRWRLAVGYTGETLKPNTWYKIKGKGIFAETKP